MPSTIALWSTSLLLLPSTWAASFNWSIPALNPQLNNTLDAGTGPVLYYNGSGNVPQEYILSPDPAPLPALTTAQIEDAIFAEIVAAGTGSEFSGNCTKCIAQFEIFHIAALTQSPTTITNLLIRTCNEFNLTVAASSCESEYSGSGGTGPYFAQLFQKMNLATGDMQAFCHYEFGVCDVPPVIEIDESQWFTPKPANKTTAPAPSGETIPVIHFSDWHLDLRFDIGSEANCSQGMCCRTEVTNTDLGTTSADPSLPASRWGNFLCDTSPDLGLSAFASMHKFLNMSDVAFSIFTGDIISHDPDDQQSEAYVGYEETISYQTFKAQLPGIPVYATLGNHDSIPSGFNAPNNINGGSGSTNPMAWNYELLSSLWLQEQWISSSEAQFAASHYGAYATVTKEGLKVISINTDFWYTPNVYNYYNFTNPDNSGILRFLISELSASEAADQRVWIIGHVPSGGGSSITNPSALFASIVRRFSPSTIAGVFFGHTHKDSKSLYYDVNRSGNSSSQLVNTTDIDFNSPLNVGWVCPSVAPRTNYNSGWSVYQVDSKTFDIINAQTYWANISDTLSWNASGPVWSLEYDTRSTYDLNNTWPSTAPLNATFWDRVMTTMMTDDQLLERYQFLETKQSAMVSTCSNDKCRAKAICTIRSGSAAEAALC